MERQSAIVSGYSPDGKSIISVIVKRTCILKQKNVTVANDQIPGQCNDMLSDPYNPLNCEMLYENDTAAYKPTTDIVVQCKAHAPHGNS